MPALRLLVIDDQPATTEIVRRMLQPHGCNVRAVHDPVEVFDVAREFRPQFALIDYFMPLIHGDVLAWLLAKDPELAGINIILFSSMAETLGDLDLPPGVRIAPKPITYRDLSEWLELESPVSA